MRADLTALIRELAAQLKDQLTRLEGETGGETDEALWKAGKSQSNTEINRGTHGREEEHSPVGCESN